MILGLQIDDTSGVAVYESGKIVYAASEERFTRKKNDSSYPIHALMNAIKKCNIRNSDIEKVVIASENITPVHMICNLFDYSIDDYLREEKLYFGPKLLGNTENSFGFRGGADDYLDVFKEKAKKTNCRDLYLAVKNLSDSDRIKVFNKWRIQKISQDLGISEDKVEIIKHEYAHAAYGLYASDYYDKDNVLTVVYDGYGDYSNASIYVCEKGKLAQIKMYSNYNVGRFYRYITLLLGMKPGEHEYKVMGLAPYATEYIYSKPLEVFRKAYQFSNGDVIVDPELRDNYFYFKERLDGMRFDGIAGAVQKRTEELNKQLIDFWLNETGKRKVAISGGVSLNIKANMEIGKMNSVDDIFVPGSGGDESLCIGAIFAWLDKSGRGDEISGLQTLYLGDEAGDISAIDSIVDKTKYNVTMNVSNREVAKKIAEGNILGRVCGRMEFGARALGNRSILADPRKRDTVENINRKIKNRDFWMPFAPSILEEDANLYINNPKGFRFPYMSVGADTTDFAKESIPASIHPADKTARPQLVNEMTNKEYHNLISEFKSVTGIGCLLNTSLNLHGYPIVMTYKDAYKVLENSELDGLILDGNVLVMRRRESD